MKFGEKIKAARTTLNLTQTELAELTGISERSLYTYEQLGTLPRKSNIPKLADALHVSVSYLCNEGDADPGKAFEEEAFLAEAREKYGSRGAKQAQEALRQVNSLFAGGELDEEAKDVFMQSLMEVYLSSKAKASEKFTPKSVKRKRHSQSV